MTEDQRHATIEVARDGWKSVKLGDFISLQRGHDLTWRERRKGDVPVMGSAGENGYHDVAIAKGPGVVLGRSGASFGTAHYCTEDFWPHNTALYVTDFHGNDPLFSFYLLDSIDFSRHNSGGAQQSLNRNFIAPIVIGAPDSPEQRAIAEALGDVDALLGALDAVLAKKRDLKQAAMQQLLTGQTRLPGFSGEWETKQLGMIAECLDQVRIPLNEAERAKRQGDIPYCGANGVLDFVDDFVIDDDIILMAEDGGYFDEYESRPIAYRMIGKCWVNNHAHILKAKIGCDQGFLFYALVHKNVLPYLASGTRAKLNKSEMNKIEISVSTAIAEQTAIAIILTDMDAELTAIEARRTKTQALKQGMMQELLTGRTRLV